MALKTYKPTTAGQRRLVLVDYASVLTASKPEKSLVHGMSQSGGRNNRGRITTLNTKRGGGHKRRYRDIDFRRRGKDGITGVVKTIEYDPNRSCFICLVAYTDGEKRYILAPEGLKVGDKIQSGERTEPNLGCCMEVGYIPQGLLVHNIELNPGQGGKICRSAGLSATVLGRDGDYVTIALPSGEYRKIHSRCRGTLGGLSNGDHFNQMIGKAGRNRWLGKRPRVCGNSMNPVDHPMGGGNDHSGGGRQPVDAKGQTCKGRRTRKDRKPSTSMIVRSRRGRSAKGAA